MRSLACHTRRLFSRILAYADVCGHMLTYADVCAAWRAIPDAYSRLLQVCVYACVRVCVCVRVRVCVRACECVRVCALSDAYSCLLQYTRGRFHVLVGGSGR